MRLTLLSPSTPWPGGGVLGIVEFANAMARRGHDVHLAHVEYLGTAVQSLEQLQWCEMDPRLIHHFGVGSADLDVPGSEAVICFDERIPDHLGAPAMLVQAYGILPAQSERAIYGAPIPKLCTSTWLRSAAVYLANPPSQTFHLPYGLRHETYRVLRPVEDRPRRVCMLVNPHPLKRADLGLAALDLVRRRDPAVDVVLFGTGPRPGQVPDDVTYVRDPSRRELVGELYNGSALFVSPAHLEGFGLAPLEAMACGCALVTTDNGGCWDYAEDRVTAAVVPEDAEAIADRIEELLTEDATRRALACRGMATAAHYTWDRSGEVLEGILDGYLRDPDAHRRPVEQSYDRRKILAAGQVLSRP